MMQTPKPFGLAVYVGQFQPPHAGHFHRIRHGLELADRLLAVISSAGAARRPDILPFTAAEREEMIRAGLAADQAPRVAFAAVPDFGDLFLWAAAVRDAAERLGGGRIALMQCADDETSRRLSAFAGWSLEAFPSSRDGPCAAELRRELFDGSDGKTMLGGADDRLPAGVKAWLARFVGTADHQDLVEEWAFAQRYREAWKAAPYPPVFVTADAAVFHRGEVLLIQRKRRPGKDLWALPGGFVEQDERVLDGAVRELFEETGLEVSEAELRGALRATAVFDDPRRDIRGRMITHAALFHLPDDRPRPWAAASDDASDLCWRPIAGLRSDALYGDHFQIIHTFARMLATHERRPEAG